MSNYGEQNAYTRILSKGNFNEIMKTNYRKDQIDRFFLEDVLNIIEGLNKKAR